MGGCREGEGGEGGGGRGGRGWREGGGGGRGVLVSCGQLFGIGSMSVFCSKRR